MSLPLQGELAGTVCNTILYSWARNIMIKVSQSQTDKFTIWMCPQRSVCQTKGQFFVIDAKKYKLIKYKLKAN